MEDELIMEGANGLTIVKFDNLKNIFVDGLGSKIGWWGWHNGTRWPFKEEGSLALELTGSLLMFLLTALSTMGGLSGAGSNIPLMLVFFRMEMKEAVPLSAIVGICSTLTRFILNFSQKHPHNG